MGRRRHLRLKINEKEKRISHILFFSDAEFGRVCVGLRKAMPFVVTGGVQHQNIIAHELNEIREVFRRGVGRMDPGILFHFWESKRRSRHGLLYFDLTI